jgi:hypothetical protein
VFTMPRQDRRALASMEACPDEPPPPETDWPLDWD